MRTYTIAVDRASSSDAGLDSFGMTVSGLSPAFSPDTFDYTLDVACVRESFTFVLFRTRVRDGPSGKAASASPVASGGWRVPFLPGRRSAFSRGAGPVCGRGAAQASVSTRS